MEKNKVYKKSPQSLSALNQWVQQKMDEKTKGWQSILQWRSSYGRLSLWSFPHLRLRKSIWQDFLSIPVLLMDSVCKFITAQQFGWWLKGGEGGVRGGRNGGGEAVGPALPALGPALAGNCNSSSGGKVSSAWLPLTSSKCLPLCLLFNSVFFCFDTLPFLLWTVFYL